MEAPFQSPIKDGVCCHISFYQNVTFGVRNVVLYQALNNHTEPGGSCLNSHEITAFYGIQLDGYSCDLYCKKCNFYIIGLVVFPIVVTTFPLNLAIIGQMLKKKKHFRTSRWRRTLEFELEHLNC